MNARVRPSIVASVVGFCALLLAAGCATPPRATEARIPPLTEPERNRARAWAHYTQALLCEAQEGRRSPQALKHFTLAAELDPGSHRLYAKVATGCLLNGLPDQAIAILERSCLELPQSFTSRVDLATAYQFTGNAPKAIENFRLAAEMDPTRTPVYIALTDLLFAEKRDAEAIEILDRALKQCDNAEGLRNHCYQRALNLIDDGESERGIPWFFLVARHAGSDSPKLYHLIAQLYERMNLTKEAIEAYTKATRQDTPLSQSFVKLALLQLDKDPARAIAILTRGRRVLQDDLLILLTLGQIHSFQQNYRDAIETYERITHVASGIESPLLTDRFYLQYGSACERAGEYDRAVELFEICLKRYPDAHQVLNYLAYMWAERGVHLARAMEYVGRALKHDPESAAYLDTLGWIHFRRGEYTEALEHILAARERMPDDPVVTDHLGDTWSALGNRERAIRHWTESYRMDPGNTILVEKLVANGVDPRTIPPRPEPKAPPAHE